MLDALTEVGGYLYVSGKATLAALTAVGGSLAVSGAAKLAALTAVGDNLLVSHSATLSAPALTVVGGNLVGASLGAAGRACPHAGRRLPGRVWRGEAGCPQAVRSAGWRAGSLAGG